MVLIIIVIIIIIATKCHSSYWLLFLWPGVNNTPKACHVLKFRCKVLYEGSLQFLVSMSFGPSE